MIAAAKRRRHGLAEPGSEEEELVQDEGRARQSADHKQRIGRHSHAGPDAGDDKTLVRSIRLCTRTAGINKLAKHWGFVVHKQLDSLCSLQTSFRRASRSLNVIVVKACIATSACMWLMSAILATFALPSVASKHCSQQLSPANVSHLHCITKSAGTLYSQLLCRHRAGRSCSRSSQVAHWSESPACSAGEPADPCHAGSCPSATQACCIAKMEVCVSYSVMPHAFVHRQTRPRRTSAVSGSSRKHICQLTWLPCRTSRSCWLEEGSGRSARARARQSRPPQALSGRRYGPSTHTARRLRWMLQMLPAQPSTLRCAGCLCWDGCHAPR